MLWFSTCTFWRPEQTVWLDILYFRSKRVKIQWDNDEQQHQVGVTTTTAACTWSLLRVYSPLWSGWKCFTYFLHPSRSICWCWALIPVHGCSADRSQEERLQIWIWYDFGRVEKACLSIIERWNCCILSSAVFTSLPSIYFHGFSCCRLEHLVEFSWQLFFW